MTCPGIHGRFNNVNILAYNNYLLIKNAASTSTPRRSIVTGSLTNIPKSPEKNAIGKQPHMPIKACLDIQGNARASAVLV